MARTGSGSFWKRFLGLFGLLGVLCGALAWQYRDFEWKAPPPVPKYKNQPGAQLDVSAELEELGAKPLQTARSKSAELAKLKKARATVAYPELAVPVVFSASTRKTFVERNLKFRRRELAEYQKHTADAEPARVAGERFLEAYFQNAADKDVIDPDYDKLAELGQIALDAGSRDPMLRTYHAYIEWMATGDRAPSVKTWEEALTELPQSKYPRMVEVYARYFLRHVGKFDPFDAKLVQYRPMPVAQFVKSLEEEGTSGEWRDCLCDRTRTFWQSADHDQREAFIMACLKSNSIDEYVLHNYLGRHFNDVAWKHRGTGYANTVQRHKWAEFKKYTGLAAEHLQYAWSLQPELIDAPAALIFLGNEATTEDAHFWFLRSLEAQFDFREAYISMSTTLLPRWGGSHEQMLAFAKNCIGTNRFDTLVPYIAMDILEQLREAEQVDLTAHPGVRQVLRDFVSKRNAYRTEKKDIALFEDGRECHERLILFLEECQLHDLAGEEHRLAGDTIDWTLLRHERRPGRYLAALRMAGQGDQQRVSAFDAKLRQPWDKNIDPKQLESLSLEYQELKSRLPDGDPGQAYFDHAGIILQQLRQFSMGEWAKLEFGKDMRGWEAYCDVTHRDDNSVELKCENDDQELTLRPLANFQPPLEVECTLELLKPSSGGSGISWSHEGPNEDWDFRTRPAFALFWSEHKNSRRDSMELAGVKDHRGYYRLEGQGPHRLRIRLWEGAAELTVDNTVWMAPALKEKCDRNGFLCIMRGTGRAKGELRVADMRVRKLDLEPAPDRTAPLDVRLKYWEERLAGDSGLDPVTMGHLCGLRYDQQRYEEAIALVDETLEKCPGINEVLVWKARALVAGRHDEATAFKIVDKLFFTRTRDDPEMLSTRAEILAMARDDKLRNASEGQGSAQLAVSQTYNLHARSLAAYAAVLSELGETGEAIEKLKQALALASDSEKREWEPRLAAYEAGKTYRYPGPENDK